jgi:hypothetical protein
MLDKYNVSKQYELLADNKDLDKKEDTSLIQSYFSTPSQETKLDNRNLEYTNKYLKNTKGSLGFQTFSTKKETLDDLEKDKEFQARSARFMEGIERNEDIFEYLRDTDYSISSAIGRSIQVGNWTPEEKEDYNYLRRRFDNAEVGSTKQYLQLAGNVTVDILADPINWLSALFFVPSGGFSGASALASREVVKQGLKQLTKKTLPEKTLQGAKTPAIYGAAEGAAWTGVHDYFLQSADVELGMRESIDLSQTAVSTALGGALGATFGGAIGAITTASPILYKKLYKYSDENEVIDRGNNASRKEHADEYETDQAVDAHNTDEQSKKDRQSKKKKDLDADENLDGRAKTLSWKKRALAHTFGKPTVQFIEMAENSEMLKQLLGRFRYDWQRTLQKGAQNVERESYGLELSRVTHGHKFSINKALNSLYRSNTIFTNNLDQTQNNQFLYLIRDKKELEKAIAGETITYNGQAIEPVVINAVVDVRKVLNQIHKESVDAGLLTRQDIEGGDYLAGYIEDFFPRHFDHSKIKANKAGLIKIIQDSEHSKIQNVYPESAYARGQDGKIITRTLEDGTVEKVLGPEAKWIDREAFGKDFLSEANGDELAAREAKATLIVNNMLEKKYSPFQFGTKNNGGSGHQFLQPRVFNTIKDNDLAEFLDTDVENILEAYVTDASRAITRTKFFGKTEASFEKKWLKPIEQELLQAGVSRDVIQQTLERIRKMHQRVTGLDTDSIRKSGAVGTALDVLKLSQQMAHLPFATISSVTEPLILLASIDSTAGKFAATRDVGQALVKGVKKDINKLVDFSRRVSGKKVKGFRDIDDDYWKEAYQVGLAMEQAVMDRIEGLTGEALQNSGMKKIQNAFFKANFLTSWTGAVQLAAFTTGKRIIRENTEQLYLHNKGSVKLSQSKKDYLEKQLYGLGIDEKQAIRVYEASSQGGGFDSSLWEANSFYKNSVMPGANRFTREVILNPSTAEANRPLWFSHPAGQILAQFAGYPTVFNNTVLKKWVSEGMFEHKLQTSPRILGTGLAMTSIAVFMNAVRSGGRSLEESDGKIILEGVQRWGGLGPGDYAYRFYENAKSGSGQAGALLKTPSGPIVADAMDMILYRKGFFEMLGTNVPGYSAFPKEFRDGLKDGSKTIDKSLWGGMFPSETVKRKSNKTFNPYQTKKRKRSPTSFKDGGLVEEFRQPLVFGGLVSRMARYVSPSKRKQLLELSPEATEDELLQHATSEVRKDMPVFEDNQPSSIYTNKEADEFSKNADEEVMRYSIEDKVSSLEEELRYSSSIGVHVGDEEFLKDQVVTNKLKNTSASIREQEGSFWGEMGPDSKTTYKDQSIANTARLKGRLRLERPLEFTDTLQEKYNFQAINFLKEIQNNPEVRDNIIGNSVLPKKQATTIVSDLLYRFDETLSLDWESVAVNKEGGKLHEHLLDVKYSIQARNALTELGYDSIKYKNSNGNNSYILFSNNQLRVTKSDKYLEEKGDMSRYLPYTDTSSPLGLYSKTFETLNNLPDKLFQGKNKTVRGQDLEKHLLSRGFKKPQIQEMLIALRTDNTKLWGQGLITSEELVEANLKAKYTKQQLVDADQKVFKALDNLNIETHKDQYSNFIGKSPNESLYLGSQDVVSVHFKNKTEFAKARNILLDVGNARMGKNTHFNENTLSWTRASEYQYDKKLVTLIEEVQGETDVGGQLPLSTLVEPYHSNWDRFALLARLKEEAKSPSIKEVVLTSPDHLRSAGMELNENALQQWYHPTKGRYQASLKDIAKEFDGEVKYKKFPFMQGDTNNKLSQSSINSIEVIKENFNNSIKKIKEQNNITPALELDYLDDLGGESFTGDRGLINDIQVLEGFNETLNDFIIAGENEKQFVIGEILEVKENQLPFLKQISEATQAGGTNEIPITKMLDEFDDILTSIYTGSNSTVEVPYIEMTDKFRKNLLSSPARLFKNKGGRVRYAKGMGVSKDVPNVKDEPENAINSLTGQPYAVGSVLTEDSLQRENQQDQMVKLGLSKGGKI